MKVVFSTDQIYKIGGIEKVLCEKASYFADVLHFDVTIVTTRQMGKDPIYFLSNKVKCMDLGMLYKEELSYFHVANLRHIPTHVYRVRKLIKEIKAEVWIVCNYSIDFFFMPFLFKGKLIKEYHGSQYTRLSWKRKTPLQRLIISTERKYSAIVLLNEYERFFFHGDNLVVIPNVQKPIPIKASFTHKSVIAAGRVAPVKGFERLVEIWKKVVDRSDEGVLHIYGPDYGGTKEKLLKLIADHGIEARTKILEEVSDLSVVLPKYSIYAMTSYTECFPMVLLEAQAVGLPVVAYDVQTGPKAIVSHKENGFLPADGNEDEFVERILLLLNNDKLWERMSSECEKSVKRFSYENVMQKWRDLLIN